MASAVPPSWLQDDVTSGSNGTEDNGSTGQFLSPTAVTPSSPPAGPEPRQQQQQSESTLVPTTLVGATPAVETRFVREVYDNISAHWSSTRYKPWPRVLEFLRSVPKAGLVADVGCGNGKYFAPALDAGVGGVLGLDASIPLLQIALEKVSGEQDGYDEPWKRKTRASTRGLKRGVNGEARQDWVAGSTTASAEATSTFPRADSSSGVESLSASGSRKQRCCDAAGADVVRLAVRSAVVDAVVCIAVLHHLSTRARRVAALREMARVLVQGGRLLVYAWAKEQENGSRRTFPAQDVFVPWQHRQQGKSYKPGEQGDFVMQRYCHVYVEGELQSLVAQVPDLHVESSYFDKGNWCVVAAKV